jgi:hypothetical protein
MVVLRECGEWLQALFEVIDQANAAEALDPSGE